MSSSPGGGLGGLALAQGLRRAGISASVHEKDPDPEFRIQGYRIRINPDGITALQALLTPQAFALFAATAGTPGPRMDTFDQRLDLLHAQELPLVPGLPGGGNLAVNRRMLRQILLSGLEKTVHYGTRLTHYDVDPSGSVTAHFADGTSATGDVLVGADGVNSAVRGQYLPQAQVVDAGLRLIYGKVPFADEAARALLPPELLGLWTTVVGPERRFVGLAPVRYREPIHEAAARLAPGTELSADRDYLACVFGARREQFPCSDAELFALGGVGLRALTLSLVEGWHPRLVEAVSRQDPDSLFPVSVRTSVPVAAWETTAVTLLGDAVHVMSPAIGVGANTALRDARVLTDRLVEAAAGRPLAQALHAYEAEMRAYGFDAVRESAERGHRLVGQDPLPAAQA
ncbi:FAD-dependent oxidoreductase [Streptacidiphilus fuscans]|uniref:FAD-dependent monooxygenase n=1 Tax=Streptacidiphilus fuscans TaxID=2789292 RepID=A0A931FJ03_9ACTN|nr:NAD(P)/FAD-dependent oxidoreductase [Streptacidiphilus fuscans]MBF9069865.1 FAD-dependent monooxygenase [Streptacidiphilus fuscans]MBF9073461.1 FAD-dependent monooxygenase [Streptacidiphilus fuscans]